MSASPEEQLQEVEATPPTTNAVSPLRKAHGTSARVTSSAKSWTRPDKFIEQLPTKTWSVLDMFSVPAEAASLPEEEHGKLIAGLARVPPSGQTDFAPDSLAAEAPISLFEELVAIVALAIFFTAPGFGPVAVLLAPALWLLLGWTYTPLIILALTLFLATYAPSLHPGLKHNFAVRAVYRYFSFRIAFSPESKYTADRPYIHVVAPHALFPIGGLLWQLSPYVTSRYHGRAGVASAVTRIPLWRQFFYGCGCVPADRTVLTALLADGHHTGVAIDGIAGIFADACRPHSSPAVIMRSRKGVVRLAKRHGVPLVPCWFFVARRPLRNLLGASGEWLSRALKVSFVLPYGRFGPGLPAVPRRAAITAVIGRPVEVGAASAEPTDAEIDELHAKLMAEMSAAFDSQKAAFGWAERELEIL